MEFLLACALANNVTNLLLAPLARQVVGLKLVDVTGLVIYFSVAKIVLRGTLL
jgi:hypothetical protein